VPRRLHLAPHHSPDALGAAYRAETDALRARQLQVVWMVARDIPTPQIQDATGLSASWVYAIVRRYNDGGLAALGDRRAGNGGHHRLLSDAQLAALQELLDSPPPSGERWSTAEVAAWMSEQLDRTISRKVAWRHMVRLGHAVR
jgi:transposase